MASSGRNATLPIFIRKDTTRALDCVDKEKSFSGATWFGEVPDFKEHEFSDPEAASSGTCSAADGEDNEIEIHSLHHASVQDALTPPAPAHALDVPLLAHAV
ncbi:hypothetical protein B0H19DRAFT_1274811 [Mycena capillaripes]|nr:hypothetical protein B0H19DRAFT_1274811 [Mycena capillaripes]